MSDRTRVLFVADAVTLAHVARPAALAGALDPQSFDVTLGCDPRYHHFARSGGLSLVTLNSMDSARFLANAARGRPLYDVETLRRYVRDDLALIESMRPDVVVGDHRLSLSISARVAGVPYLALINAYWSPFTVRRLLPVPELPMNRVVGTRLAQWLFRLGWPVASMIHTRPLNRLRKEYGLPALGSDWFRVYTDADRVLYPDAEELIPTRGLPENHAYLGPVLWSPPLDVPDWWDELTADRPLIYATMGSSGHTGLLATVLGALEDLPVSVVATTAAKSFDGCVPANVRLLDFAPGDKLAARAALMICNGGSLTVYQSLAAGKPVIGIASHMDQHLSMTYVAQAGVGVHLRSETLTAASLRAVVRRLLDDETLHRNARAMGRIIGAHDPAARLRSEIGKVTRAGR